MGVYLISLAFISFVHMKCIDVSHCDTTNELTITSILLSLRNVENKHEYVLYFLIGLFSDLDQGEKCVSFMCNIFDYVQKRAYMMCTSNYNCTSLHHCIL